MKFENNNGGSSACDGGCGFWEWDWAAAPWVQDPSLASIARAAASITRSRAMGPAARVTLADQSRDLARWVLQLARCLLTHRAISRDRSCSSRDGCCTHSPHVSLFVAKILVRQCARLTKTHRKLTTHVLNFCAMGARRTNFCATMCPSHKFLCDSVPVAQKLTTHVLNFCATGARRKDFCATACPSHKNLCAMGAGRTKICAIQIFFHEYFIFIFVQPVPLAPKFVRRVTVGFKFKHVSERNDYFFVR